MKDFSLTTMILVVSALLVGWGLWSVSTGSVKAHWAQKTMMYHTGFKEAVQYNYAYRHGTECVVIMRTGRHIRTPCRYLTPLSQRKDPQ